MDSKDTTFVEAGNIKTTAGISLNPSVSSEEPTQPSESEIATGNANVNVKASSNLSSNVTAVEIDKTTAKVILPPHLIPRWRMIPIIII